MPLSNSFVRRYTPPTCSLEVAAESSPLSRWMGRTVLKQLRFVLSFDDPRSSEEDRITIRGDRQQLEALHTAVTTYVQELLQQSPDRFHAAYLSGANEIEKQETSVNSAPQTIALNPNPFVKNGVHLQPSNNGLNHDLYLGSMFTENPPVVRLSVLQLFDLATALDEYAADAVALPTQKRRKLAIPSWAPVAAVAAVAVGLIPLIVPLLPKRTTQTASTDAAAQPPQNIAQLPPLATPPATGITPLAVPDKLPTIPPPLSSIPQVPTTTFPTPGSTVTVPGTKTGIPNTQIPGSIANTTTTTGFPSTFSPSTNPSGVTFGITPTDNQRTSKTKTSPAKTRSTVKENPFITTASLPSRIDPVSSPLGAPQPVTPKNVRRGAANVQPSIATSTGVPDTSSAQLIDRLGGNTRTSPEASTDATAFDTTPQVAEARAYLKRRWKAPSGLKDSLQYSVTVDVDGSVQRILPLGNLATKYVDQSGMPAIGSHFVSANKNGQTSEIRVLLNPDGTVKTFPLSP